MLTPQNQARIPGYPGWAQTEEQKQQYVRYYRDKEGIALDSTMIQKNPGR